MLKHFKIIFFLAKNRSLRPKRGQSDGRYKYKKAKHSRMVSQQGRAGYRWHRFHGEAITGKIAS